jgi:uncharacterized repeat protein (TIGR01451 family)
LLNRKYKEALMVLKHLGWAIALVIALCAPPLAGAADQEGLVGTVEAYRLDRDADGNEAFVPAEQARPQDVIEYRLTYKNNNETPIQNLTIIDPIPVGMRYLSASATDNDAGRVEFSIDHGKSYHRWPVMRTVSTSDGTKVTTEATPDMVTHVRWIVTDTLNPAKEITVTYRASVK